MGRNERRGVARLRSTKVQQRAVMTVDDVRAVMAATATIDPAAELALRIAAIAGTRRAELASLRWTDEQDGRLLIDSAIEITKRGDGKPELREAATKTANVRTVTLDPDGWSTPRSHDPIRRTPSSTLEPNSRMDRSREFARSRAVSGHLHGILQSQVPPDRAVSSTAK
jgi:integrase